MPRKKNWIITNKNCKKVINANLTNSVKKISGVGASIYINNDQKRVRIIFFMLSLLAFLK